MNNPVRPRRVIALIAAYVVGLQALLLPLSVAAASPLINSLCVSAADNMQTPVSHDSGCPCAVGCGMQCCAQAMLGSLPISFTGSLTVIRVMTPPLALAPVVQAGLRTPQNPRAPPAVA
jgi:hypothetical protein